MEIIVLHGRHKGRIERLRVLLAYGFEARTQHQLSSSRRGDANDGAATKTPTPPPSLTLRAKEHAPHYSTTKAASRHQPKGDMNVVSFHAVIKLFGPQRCCPSCGGGCTRGEREGVGQSERERVFEGVVTRAPHGKRGG